MDGLMTIGEFSAASGLSPRRLRSYATAGLLTPVAVDPESSYRYYSPQQLPQARLIDVLRRAGMPLGEIKATLRERHGHRLDEWAARVRSDAEARQQAIARARELLASEDEEPTTMDDSQTAAVKTLRLRVAGRTETGSVRANNEDTVVVSEQLIAVADGMGGHRAGEIASSLATAAVAAVFTGKSADELQAALRAANWAVWDRACNAPDLQGMGTTMCAVGVLEDATVAVANVGDSRAYLSRAGALQAITCDHTVAAELARQGQLTSQEAAEHPHRRLLTRALGVGADVTIDLTCLQLLEGDRVLVCSDGAFGPLQDDQIGAILDSSETPQDVVDAIVDLALASGSDDNASAVAAFASR